MTPFTVAEHAEDVFNLYRAASGNVHQLYSSPNDHEVMLGWERDRLAMQAIEWVFSELRLQAKSMSYFDPIVREYANGKGLFVPLERDLAAEITALIRDYPEGLVAEEDIPDVEDSPEGLVAAAQVLDRAVARKVQGRLSEQQRDAVSLVVKVIPEGDGRKAETARQVLASLSLPSFQDLLT